MYYAKAFKAGSGYLRLYRLFFLFLSLCGLGHRPCYTVTVPVVHVCSALSIKALVFPLARFDLLSFGDASVRVSQSLQIIVIKVYLVTQLFEHQRFV